MEYSVTFRHRVCLVAFVVGIATSAFDSGIAGGEETAIPITVVNYTSLPVYATAIPLDEQDLVAKLGVSSGTPLQVRSRDQQTKVFVAPGKNDGRSVLWLYVSMPPASRLDLVAARAERWPGAPPIEAKQDLLRNGVARVAFAKKGWQFGFDAEKAAVIEDGTLDFWIDDQNRGRILNIAPEKLGLARFADSQIEKAEAGITPTGRPSLQIVRRMTGLAKSLTVTETFELVPHLPVLICRVRWQNDGDTPLWVAYVGSGNGIAGRWAKPLLTPPLIERKKSPLLGDLNGGETRCAWLGGLCRISMESPTTGCGVGLSTLLPTPGKVGQGSMIWGCGASGFQCNFIDPVQGQFPFLVKPHDRLENGFAFLATQAGLSVFRQTLELWKKLQAEELPTLTPPCAVFVGGQAVHAQTITGLEKSTERQIALRLDFNKHFECRVVGATKLTARPLVAGKSDVVLLDSPQPDEHVVDLNQRLGWKDEASFVLEQSGDAAISVMETLPTAPKALSPVPDAEFTDFAAMFRWCSLPMVVDYDLQWSRTADFQSPTEIRVTSSQEFPWYLVPDDRLPAPGRWYWRIRGVKGTVLGVWSETRSFVVNNEHTKKPLKRPLTPERPLFTLEATRVLDYTNFRPDIPADIASYVGIIAEGFEGKDLPVTEFARGLEKLPHAIMLRSHWVGLADIEWLCQHVPNFIGIQGGEHLSSLYRDNKDGDMRYHHRLTKICAKYGLLYQEADGTYKDDKWQELLDQQGPFVREYGPWLVLSQKNNIIRRQFYSQSAAMGLWLGGITHQHGAWEDGGFYWQNAGFNGLGVCNGERTGMLRTMPRIFWTLNFVMGISRGCGIYSLDGQTLMDSSKLNARQPDAAWASAIWDETGKTTATFQQFVAPLIRGVVEHRLLPTKEEVLQNVKLAVYNDKQGPGDSQMWPHYAEYGPLYAATYGFRKMGRIDGQLWEFFPNTGRYYFIPVLVQGNEPLAPHVKNLSVSQLQDRARVQEVFNIAYPSWYEGDALACRVGDTLTIQNTRENEDVTESYGVPLTNGWLTKLAGNVPPHSYVVGKLEDKQQRLWLQTNSEYPDREMTISVDCARKPQWQITPAAAVKSATWEAAAKSLKLRILHQPGAVEITVW